MAQRFLPETADARLREEAAALRAALAEVEDELASLRLAIDVAEQRYLAVVGPVLARLQETRARLLALLARDDPAQQARADRAAEEAREYVLIVEAPPRPPATEELRNLFRRAARELHPDLAVDEEDRRRRHDLMAAANAAMEARDIDALERLLARRETQRAPATTVTRADLDYVRGRLAQAREELSSLRGSSGGRLAARLQDGEDVLVELRAELEAELAEVEATLAAHP